ncbi:MAG: hypothetical protein HOF23_08570 [Rhodospirillaceae bacterium]|nr:hypothetical protein [Rhodospirillaceae bacterium]
MHRVHLLNVPRDSDWKDVMDFLRPAVAPRFVDVSGDEGVAGYAFEEIARRQGDFAIVAIAAIAEGESIRIGVGGVAGKPEIRNWDILADNDLDEALNSFAWELGDNEDIHASAKYRRQLVRRVGRRVIEEARKCRS